MTTRPALLTKSIEAFVQVHALPPLAVPETGDSSLEAVAYLLARHGHFARVVSGELENLKGLREPTLVEITQGVGLIQRASARSVTVLEPDGTMTPTSWERFARDWTGRYIGFRQSEKGRTVFAIVSLELRRNWGALRMLAAATLIGSLAAVGIPLITRRIINHAVPQASEPLIWALSLATTASLVLAAIAYFAQRSGHRAIEAALHVRVLNSMMSAILQEGVSASPSRDESGERAQRVTSATVTSRLVIEAISALPGHLANVAGGALALLTLDAATALLTLAVSSTFFIAAVIFVPKARAAAAEELKAAAAARQTLMGTLFSALWIKATGLARWKVRANHARSIDERERVRRRREISQVSSIVLSATHDGGAAALLFWCAWRVRSGGMSLGGLAASTQLGYMIFGAVAGVGRLIFTAVESWEHVASINRCLSNPANVRAAPQSVATARTASAIDTRGVWFQYGADLPWVVVDENLLVRWGERIEIRGRSGAGKTTLLRLLSGMLLPTRGAICVAGRSPRPSDDTVLYVPQNCRLFAGSIRENLLLMSRGASRADVIRAAECTGLMRLLVALPMGEDTRIAGGGAAFSAGQRQLIVLTSALASRAPILLFDEVFAHFDPERRRTFRDLELLDGRTIVSVTHETAPQFEGALPRTMSSVS